MGVDRGIGIPAGYENKIFEPYFTTKLAGEGTGLGLSMASKIIDQLGGTISVQSEVGSGTKFTISLPISKSVYPMVENVESNMSTHPRENLPLQGSKRKNTR